MPICIRIYTMIRARYGCSPYSTAKSITNSEKKSTELAKEEKPLRIMDISLTNGSPTRLRTARHVYIFQPCKSGMTSGRAHINSPASWKLEFDHAEERWENPLMGWTSTRDTMNQLDLRFKSAQDAMGFAEKNGWNYTVRGTTEESLWKEKAYANNFKYSSGKLRTIPTK